MSARDRNIESAFSGQGMSFGGGVQGCTSKHRLPLMCTPACRPPSGKKKLGRRRLRMRKLTAIVLPAAYGRAARSADARDADNIVAKGTDQERGRVPRVRTTVGEGGKSRARVQVFIRGQPEPGGTLTLGGFEKNSTVQQYSNCDSSMTVGFGRHKT